jgi:O-antigen/teichoic acid export membrane protein
LAAMTSVIMNVVLVPRVGILGAALSNCASYLVLAATALVLSRRDLHYSFNALFFGKVVAATVVMVVCMNVLKMNNTLTGTMIKVAAGGAAFVASLLLLRAFSVQDRQLVIQMLGNSGARLHKRR